MILNTFINQCNSMYPALSYMLTQDSKFNAPTYARWCSIYGYSFGENKIDLGGKQVALSDGQYFSFFVTDRFPEISVSSQLFLVIRLGYKCQNQTGWVEEQGRLSYIDTCSDSLLIYPSRQGDPSLNLLHFPPGIAQSRHIHPSIRMGCVIAGEGESEVWEGETSVVRPLKVGDHFCLTENERHRFITHGSHMTVIAWHPDGDWGPTDHNHTMLNRTYVNK